MNPTWGGRFIERVAYRTGAFDISEERDYNMLSDMILACREHMLSIGVKSETLDDPLYEHIVLASLVLFVTDNLNISGGDFKYSSMYYDNVDQLRITEEV